MSNISFSEDFEVVAQYTSMVELGPDDIVPTTSLSCSVANEGFFAWQWKFEGELVPFERSIQEDSDGTKSTTLEIQKLDYVDRGMYICELRHEAWDILIGSSTFTLTLNCKSINSKPRPDVLTVA